MTPTSLSTIATPDNYRAVCTQKAGAPGETGSPSTNAQAADRVELSSAALREVAFAGRVAAQSAAGNLTSDQTQQLYSQVASVHSQIAADLQAGGGTISSTGAQAIQQSQNDLSAAIYSNAHHGDAPPAGSKVTRADVRESVEAGRITLNEKAGNLTAGQARQLASQLGDIQQQIAANGQPGSSPSPTEGTAINQLQNLLSQEIQQAAHGSASPA